MLVSVIQDEDFEDERANLVTNEATVRIEDVSVFHDNADGPGDPSWLSLVDDFRYEASKLNDKIEKLREDQETYMRLKSTALFDEGERSVQSVEEEMESKSADISRSFNRLHGLVLEMKNLSILRQGNKVLRNILQYEYKEVASLSEKLRNYHRNHLTRLNEKERYMEQFVINFDDIDFPGTTTSSSYSDHIGSNTGHGSFTSNNESNSNHNQRQISFHDDPHSASSSSLHAVGFDNRNYDKVSGVQLQDQVEVDFSDMDIMRERDEEMSSILKSMVELNTIFNEMNSMVVNQGSLMDRIDYNMEVVHMKVEEGGIQLSRAERSARAARKLKCVLILGGSLLLALIIMILQS